MPILKSGQFDIDYLDVGSGPAVILIHSAASNNRQWRALIEDHKHQYRFIAPNLFGYGYTSAWPAAKKQSIDDHVSLIEALSTLVDDGFSIVGHSLGGTIAAFAASKLGTRVRSLILLEANPFPLLNREGRKESFAEVLSLRDFIVEQGEKGEWQTVGERFVDYWLGPDSWQRLSPERQQTFIEALPNNVYEWDAVMDIDSSAGLWQSISARTLLFCASETKLPIAEIYAILRQDCPHWDYQEITEGGHMAPITRPDLVNPTIIEHIEK